MDNKLETKELNQLKPSHPFKGKIFMMVLNIFNIVLQLITIVINTIDFMATAVLNTWSFIIPFVLIPIFLWIIVNERRYIAKGKKTLEWDVYIRQKHWWNALYGISPVTRLKDFEDERYIKRLLVYNNHSKFNRKSYLDMTLGRTSND